MFWFVCGQLLLQGLVLVFFSSSGLAAQFVFLALAVMRLLFGCVVSGLLCRFGQLWRVILFCLQTKVRCSRIGDGLTLATMQAKTLTSFLIYLLIYVSCINLTPPPKDKKATYVPSLALLFLINVLIIAKSLTFDEIWYENVVKCGQSSSYKWFCRVELVPTKILRLYYSISKIC